MKYCTPDADRIRTGGNFVLLLLYLFTYSFILTVPCTLKTNYLIMYQTDLNFKDW